MCQFGVAGGSQEIEIVILSVELACKFITSVDPMWKASTYYVVPAQKNFHKTIIMTMCIKSFHSLMQLCNESIVPMAKLTEIKSAPK